MQPSNTDLQNTPTETNNTIQNTTPTTKSPNYKTPLYICLCFAILSTVAAGVFAYLYFSNPNIPTPQPQANSAETDIHQEENDISDTTEEIAITDENTIKDLDEKLLILHRANYPSSQQFEKSIFISMSPGYEIPLYEEGTLNDIRKLTHLIDSIPENSFRTLSEAEKQSIQAEPSKYDSGRIPITTGIDADIVATKYKALYGYDLIHGALNNNYTYCPQYNYNKEYHVYYMDSSGCGGQWPATRQYYKYKYTTDNNHAYVYVAAGLIEFLDNGGEQLLCDVVNTDNAQSCGNVPENYSYNKTPFINSSNYQNFANYRFVFNKADDGTYFFSKVEKL